MTAVDRSIMIKEWQARGFSCDLWVDPPGQVWEDYVHETDELVIPVEGRLEFEFGTSDPRADIEVTIPARVRHSVRNIGGTFAKWLYGYKREPQRLIE